MPSQPKPNDDESLRLELQESLTSFRHWVTQINQGFGVVATGDALLVTYAFSQRLASILFLASILPIMALLVYLQVMSAAAPIVSLAVRIERRLHIHDSLATVYASTHLRSRISDSGNIDSLSNDELLNLDFPKRYWLRNQVSLILYASTAVQVALAVLGMTVYHYRFM